MDYYLSLVLRSAYDLIKLDAIEYKYSHASSWDIGKNKLDDMEKIRSQLVAFLDIY